MANKKSRWDFTAKHHADILKIMQKIIDAETVDTVCGDDDLTEKIKAQGVYSTATITRQIRIDNGIGGIDQRKVEAFAREHKKKGGK